MSRGLRGARSRLSKAEAWVRQATRMVRFLETLKRTETVHGTSWNAGTRAYYRPKLAAMLAHPPKGAEREAAALVKRFRKV